MRRTVNSGPVQRIPADCITCRRWAGESVSVLRERGPRSENQGSALCNDL